LLLIPRRQPLVWTTSVVAVALWSVLRCGRPVRSPLNLASIQSFEASQPSPAMPSARIAITAPCCAVHPPAWKSSCEHRISASRLPKCSPGNPPCQSRGLQGRRASHLQTGRYATTMPSTWNRPAFRASHARRRRRLPQRRSAVRCILVVHEADAADQPVDPAAETLLLNRNAVLCCVCVHLQVVLL
jgi:hypothetical protein